jgi:hypothetical protein
MADLGKALPEGTSAYTSVTSPSQGEQAELDKLFTRPLPAAPMGKPVPEATAQSAPPMSWEEEADKALAPLFPTPQQQAEAAQPQPMPQPVQLAPQELRYGVPEALYHGATLGFAPQLLGAAQAAKEVGGQALASGSLAPLRDFSFYQRQAQRQYELARESEAHGEHQVQNMLAEGAGSMVPTMAGMALGGVGVAGGAGLAEKAFPYLNPLLTRVGAALTPANGIVPGALRGAIEGAGSGLLTSNLGEGPTPLSIGTGAAIGGALAPVSHVLGAVTNAAAQTAPLRALAERVRQLGVNLRLGQISNEPEIVALDKHLVSPAHNTQQLQDYTRALGRTIGEDTPYLTADVIDSAKTRIGQEMENIAQGMTVQLRGQEFAALDRIEDEMKRMTDPQAQMQVRRVIDQLQDEFLNPTAQLTLPNGTTINTIPGPRFQDLIRKHGVINQLEASADPNVKHFGSQLRSLLYSAMEGTVPFDRVLAYRTARQQYRNAVVLEPLADKAPSGIINPKLVLSRANAQRVNPQSDLGALAEAGKYLPVATAQGTAVGDAGSQTLKHLGIGGAIALAGKEFGHPILEQAREHPLLASGLTALAAGQVAKHTLSPHLLASPAFNRMAIGGGLGAYLPNFNPLIPIASGVATGVGTKYPGSPQ